MTAYLCLNSWAGRTEREVEVIGETKRRYKIRAIHETALPGRWISKGETALVPKYAIRFVENEKREAE